MEKIGLDPRNFHPVAFSPFTSMRGERRAESFTIYDIRYVFLTLAHFLVCSFVVADERLLHEPKERILLTTYY